MASREWLTKLAQNEEAVNRLEQILNHTLQSEDGDCVFPSVDDAGEVYAIMYMAFTDSTTGLADMMDLADAKTGCTIGKVTLGTIKIDEEQDEFTFTARGVRKPDAMAVPLY